MNYQWCLLSKLHVEKKFHAEYEEKANYPKVEEETESKEGGSGSNYEKEIE